MTLMTVSISTTRSVLSSPFLSLMKNKRLLIWLVSLRPLKTHYMQAEVMYKFVGESLTDQKPLKIKNRMSFNRVSQNRLIKNPPLRKNRLVRVNRVKSLIKNLSLSLNLLIPLRFRLIRHSVMEHKLTNNPSRGS